MSIFSDIWSDVRSLMLQRSCSVCGVALPRGEAVICSVCEATAPLTHMWEQEQNPLLEHFAALLPVERASALLWYVEGSAWRQAIHRFKYGGHWRAAYRLGRWYGALLKQAGLYDDVDVVVPVPLHWLRRLWRGYNQSEYIAQGIARELGVEADVKSVQRYRYNRSQARRPHYLRWANVKGIFRVRRSEAFRGKHILLVDDVLTTGSTIISLGESVLAAAPTARLSVAVLAVPRQILHIGV